MRSPVRGRTAVTVADTEGLTAVSMRRVAAEPPEGWREAIELAARQLWDLFRRHPWLAPALSVTRPQMITSALPYSEWMLATLHAHGLGLQSAFTAHLTLLNHARGIAVNLEAEREAEAHSGLDLDALFEFGLQRLLDGLAPLLNESSAD
ncbi:TetR/AcrR family transcriptional regulator C-terminal domain-containing protein [Streptomyces sp. NPDC057686]|uniref:TetR/AcrR family transcriptional regulator C-terminal domain-containing protein n=1 Tax=Streptomyces sp. NPDC057686 TaxID=3346212 RepID=UPI0036A66A91